MPYTDDFSEWSVVEHHARRWWRLNSSTSIGETMKRPEDEPEDEPLTDEEKETLEDLEKQHVPPKDDAD
jgi:hypothetical protein